jgi:hypothetical protein
VAVAVSSDRLVETVVAVAVGIVGIVEVAAVDTAAVVVAFVDVVAFVQVEPFLVELLVLLLVEKPVLHQF